MFEGLKKAIKKWSNFGWEELGPKEVPNWIKKRSKKKFWRGLHYFYKKEYGRYYRKKNNLEYPEGIPKNRMRMIRHQRGNQVIWVKNKWRDPFKP